MGYNKAVVHPGPTNHQPLSVRMMMMLAGWWWRSSNAPVVVGLNEEKVKAAAGLSVTFWGLNGNYGRNLHFN